MGYYHEPELDWGVFYVTTLLAWLLCMVFIALGIASGLFYLAEIAEEFSVVAKRINKALVVSIAVLHLLLLVFDHLSWWRSCLSIASNTAYFQLLRDFPWVRVTSMWAILSIVCFVADNVCWYSFFMMSTGEFPFWSIVSFFVLFVWLVPLGFFVSLAVAEEQLPSGYSSANRAQKKHTIASFLGSLVGR